MDIPLNADTRTLLLRCEADRPVVDSVARGALAGAEGQVGSLALRPWGEPREQRPEQPEEWQRAFEENDRFADALLKREAEAGVQPTLHLFAHAPLALAFHLGSRLVRHPLVAYDESVGGSWQPGYDRAQPAPREAEPFFRVEGLPQAPQGGRGHVALIVEVSHFIYEPALKDFQAAYPTELLATVRLQVARGPSQQAVQHPGEVSQAAAEFRQVLDELPRLFQGVESILLALRCPASLAVALGSVVNPGVHPPLRLHHFLPGRGYMPVYLLRASRQAGAGQGVPHTAEDMREATRVLGKVRAIHEELVRWLREPSQQPLAQLVGGEDMQRSQVDGTPAGATEPMFRYLRGSWAFHVELLLALKRLQQRLPSEEGWQECIRLILLHEGYHVRQRLTSYDYRGIGRAGWVLEALDYDADVASVEACLAWRKSMQEGMVRQKGEVKTYEQILWNVLEGLRLFEVELPLREMSERRLRRYLIWLFQACRVSHLREVGEVDLKERVFIEVTGLKGRPDPTESYPQLRVRLDEEGKELGLALYYRGRLVREPGSRVADLLKALSAWDQEGMRDIFERIFNAHRFLVGRE